MAIVAIEELPDYPAIQQLARAIWRRDPGKRGAAVLVGAGFSRNASTAAADSPLPPLWGDLRRALVKELYPHAPEDAPTDALRLAEEYRVYLGDAAMAEFIRRHVADEAWLPGPLHALLLDLPWSDVLTTNWDTLLERAAREVPRQDYEPVHRVADLAHARAPRIVKLHGSIGATDHFIFSEEDFRTYPEKYAAFVNLARQIFIENELCLIGFSGDDPNFLQWTGWVRDHLGGAARRIYLVGALNLGPARRKFLESRNIAPIDLWPLVSALERSEQQSAANRLFFESLKKSEPVPPHPWLPAGSKDYEFANGSAANLGRKYNDPGYAASLFEKVIDVWRRDRESYPGWLVSPPVVRTDLTAC